MAEILDAPCRDQRTPPAAGFFLSDRAPRFAEAAKEHDSECERFERLFIAGTHCRPGKDQAKG